MKRLIACIVAGSILAGLCGCSAASKSVSPLDLMKEINDSNPLSSDPSCRLWYQVRTSFFADGSGDDIGDISGLLNYIDYISDGDVTTSGSDINMSGIFLEELLTRDSSDAIVDYYSINKNYGDTASLAKLCEAADARGLDVMMRLNLAAISKESSFYTDLVAAAEALGEEATLDDLNYEYKGMFDLSDDNSKQELWALGDSNFYYRGWNGTRAALINQDDPAWRQLITNVINYYSNLGIDGFYIENVGDIFPSDSQKRHDFLVWFESMVKSINPDAVVVASSSTYDSSLDDVGIYISQTDFTGAEGYISKAVTGAMNAQELAELLKQTNVNAAYFFTSDTSNMDLIKSVSRTSELKMALGLLMMMSGQVFVSAGDEIGLSDNEVDFISQALDESNSSEEGEGLTLTFGSLTEQRDDGNSVLNFLEQAILLRNSYSAISSGTSTVLDDLTTENVLALEKDTDSSSVVILFNLANTAQTIDVSQTTIHGLPAELGGVLLSGDSQAQLEDGTLQMPAHSVVILK